MSAIPPPQPPATPGDGVAGSTTYMVAGLGVVTQAAQQIIADPPIGDAPGVPDLAAHAAAVVAAAQQFIDTLGPSAQQAVAATTAWAGPAAAGLNQVISTITAGGPTEPALAIVQSLTASAGGLTTQARALCDPLAAYDVATAGLAGTLAQDIGLVQTQIALDAQEQATLEAQASQLQDRIDQDHKWELLGWLAGPLGYLAAREIGGLIDDENGLQAQIAVLRADAQADSAMIAQLTAITGPTSVLSQGAGHLSVGAQGLVDGWTVLVGFFGNLSSALSAAGTDPPIALVPDLTAAARALQTLTGAVTPPAPTPV